MRKIVLQILYALILRPWLKIIIGVRFANRETFRDIDQFIVVANHNSHFDTISILAALPPDKLTKTHAVAAADYFGKTSFGVLLMKFFFNAILIKRNSPSAINTMDESLKQGESLIMFPEGTRGRAGVITDFKKGIAMLLHRNPDIPFVPVYLDGFGRVLPKDKFLVIPLICKVRFGGHIKPESDDIDEITEEVKDGILNLRENDQRDRNRFKYEY